MISSIIIIASLVLAGAFLLTWLARPELRRRIERPKHLFAEQIEQYDRQSRQETNSTGASDDEGK
jgi:hypothetical protein